MKDIKLLTIELFTDEDEFGSIRKYLYLKYEYKDDNGNTYNRIYPKIELPIYQDRLPIVDREDITIAGLIRQTRSYIPSEDGLELRETNLIVNGENGKVIRCDDVNMVDVITERVTKKMTLSEIEEKLGYKVEVVSEKGE